MRTGLLYSPESRLLIRVSRSAASASVSRKRFPPLLWGFHGNRAAFRALNRKAARNRLRQDEVFARRKRISVTTPLEVDSRTRLLGRSL